MLCIIDFKSIPLTTLATLHYFMCVIYINSSVQFLVYEMGAATLSPLMLPACGCCHLSQLD
jgi:hypothetical protein